MFEVNSLKKSHHLRNILLTSCLIISFFTFTYLSSVHAEAENSSADSTQSSSTSVNAISSVPVYHFQSDTVWAKLSVLVQDFHGHFRVEGQSDSPASRWFLKNSKGQMIAHGDLDAQNHFQADIPKPFQGEFQLIVLINGDHTEVPAVVRLSSSADQIFLTPTPPPYDAFEENPDQPYNKIVKNFYDQAAQAYVDGNKEKAMELLKKAKEVDPNQPQVKALEAKLKNSLEQSDSKEAIRQATADWKAGDMDHALTELDDFLKQYPADVPVLQLRKQILQSQAPKKLAKKQKAKSSVAATPTPVAKKPMLNDKDSQSQADEAYNLGLESYRKEDYTSAKKFWEETLQFQPTHLQARRNLDRLLEEHPDLK